MADEAEAQRVLDLMNDPEAQRVLDLMNDPEAQRVLDLAAISKPPIHDPGWNIRHYIEEKERAERRELAKEIAAELRGQTAEPINSPPPSNNTSKPLPMLQQRIEAARRYLLAQGIPEQDFQCLRSEHSFTLKKLYQELTENCPAFLAQDKKSSVCISTFYRKFLKEQDIFKLK